MEKEYHYVGDDTIDQIAGKAVAALVETLSKGDATGGTTTIKDVNNDKINYRIEVTKIELAN